MGEYYGGLTVEALCKLMQNDGRDGAIEINKLGGVEEICDKLGTSPTQGLGSTLEHRRVTFGSNEIPVVQSATFLKLLWNVLCDKTIVNLIILSVLLWMFVYTFVKVACLVIVITVTVIVNYSNERQFQHLLDDVTIKREVTVIRNSIATTILVDDVVVGDVCIINNDDVVPADGILVESSGLKVDESSIIGSSCGVNKELHLNPMLFSGTKIINGSGIMIAVAVGLNTRKGMINAVLTHRKGDNLKHFLDRDSQKLTFGNDKSVVQQKVHRLLLNVIFVCLIIGAVVFVLLTAQFFIRVFIIEQQSWKMFYINRLIHFFAGSLFFLLVGIPEGLPLTVVSVLALTVKKLFVDNKLVRNVHSSETMGNVTSICFDKTGTITTNRMEIMESYICESSHTWDSENNFQKIPNDIVNLIAENIAINSSSSSLLTDDGDKRVQQLGNKTECALLGFVKRIGLSFQTIRDTYSTRIAHVVPFNSERKVMGTVIKNSDGSYRLFVKGASETVLSNCKFLIGQNGKLKEMTNDLRDHITLDFIKPTTDNRLRTVSLAYRDFVINKTAVNETVINGEPMWTDEKNIVKSLTFLGVFAIDDPIRSEVPDLVEKLQSSGITVRMVTGDDINTAKSVATKCGIINDTDADIALDATDFNRRIRDSDGNIKQHLFDEVYPTLRVLARASPIDKYNLVNGIIESTKNKYREIVAMVGDGDSDALALKKADIGITFNQLSTSIAKNASDIILTDNDISGVLNTVISGRHAYDSIAKFVQFIMPVKLVSFAIITFHFFLNISTVPIYQVDLLADIMAIVPIFFYDPIQDFVQGKSYGRNEHIISKNMIVNMIGQSIYQLAVLLPFIIFSYNQEHLIFNIFVVMSLFNVFNARSLYGERNIFRKIQHNFLMCFIWILAFVVHIFATQCLGVDCYNNPMNLTKWAICFFFGVGSLIFQQLLFLCNSEKQIRKNVSEVYV